jgi:hypothetical protein
MRVVSKSCVVDAKIPGAMRTGLRKDAVRGVGKKVAKRAFELALRANGKESLQRASAHPRVEAPSRCGISRE